VIDTRSVMSKRESPDELREQLDQLIEELVTDLSSEVRKRIRESFRFANWNEVDAAYDLLSKSGSQEPMHMDVLVKELKKRGIWRGPSGSKGGADSDMKRSIGRAAGRKERLCYVGNPDDNLIGLLEWGK
jgi:hypothetical protein